MSLKPAKFLGSTTNRIVIEVLLGILLSTGIMAILINVGYSNAYASDAASYEVSIIGLPMYLLQRSGDDYVGQSVIQNMTFFSIFCSFVIALVGEILWRKRHRK